MLKPFDDECKGHLTNRFNAVRPTLIGTMSKNAVTVDKVAFAKRLREAINESDLRDLKQVDQARELGMSKSLLNMWLDGRIGNPQGIYLGRACKRLNVNSQWLVENIGPKRPGSHQAALSEEEKPTEGQPSEVVMNLRQTQEAMSQLLENIPQTARDQALKDLTQRALKEGWIDRIPDNLLATWSAKDKIRDLKTGQPPKTGTQ